MYAYDAVDGDRRWRRQVQYPHGHRYPQFGGLVDGTLFLTDSGTDVIAVDISDGTVRWRINLYEQVAKAVPNRFLTRSSDSPEQFSPLPLATPETVYIQSSYGLHGLAPSDGREQWRLYLGNHDQEDNRVLDEPGGLAVTDDCVWASYSQPTPSIYELEMFDESPSINRLASPMDLPGRPVVARDGDVTVSSQVVWSTDTHRSLAFGAAGGTDVAWQFPGWDSSGPATFSSVATDGDRVFVCEGHESKALFVVFALDASTGGLEWIFRQSLDDGDLSTAAPAEFRVSCPVVGDNTVVVGYGLDSKQTTGQGSLLGLSSGDGRLRWRTDLPMAPWDVAVAGDRVYVSGQEQGVVALSVDGE
ncbi:PQQ-binding-like beta-propeller repeat protein [Halospeciosus flavus]|uniref:PQQ-binding-like beta-propeller repeat protein n=1 Tax=Halospeciosus flavus TaxID=3032283 RepID=A0ABD5Z192_9EURY|nr:PQQ-binding-like beta-propeller repeat protein [Halospeciosus flavus]